ncbi:hypothetical protein J4E83_005918 [Alternaria metachromatica]|uniref:uncharacterized protein n=1 Tax=Alternaria metachromatica TaxID=283354 RepID=UPI0020C4C19E|nr:uncharacterized protein J4E83_005918 [Alternaria metachromatica]KAI4618967.1 hypothetical protein J4E83_005918 [Alternaria metachromatica]
MTRATAATDADINVTGLGQGPVALPIRAPSLAVSSPLSPAQANPIKHYGRDAKTFKAADLRFDDGSFNKPGTKAYYKSFGFREKTKSINDQKMTGERNEKQSLVMIFSRNAVRRSALTGSVANRARKLSKRQKFMRKVNNDEKFFKWD